ncbi:hypothetical protein ACLOJK_014377 [Asimina triloba]
MLLYESNDITTPQESFKCQRYACQNPNIIRRPVRTIVGRRKVMNLSKRDREREKTLQGELQIFSIPENAPRRNHDLTGVLRQTLIFNRRAMREKAIGKTRNAAGG